MQSKIIKFFQKPFVRNVVALASGTAAAQAISMASAPIITRLYSPEAFGVLGVYNSILVIVIPISTLTYPIAIVLPKNDTDAKGLVSLSFYIAAIMAALMACVLLFFNKPLVHLLQVEVIASYLFLIPLAIMFGAAVQIVKQWMIRKKQFKFTARVTVAHSFIINSTKVGAGLFHPAAAVLVIIATFDDLIKALMLALGARKTTSSSTNADREVAPPASKKELVKRYRDFPFFRAPQIFINAVSLSLPVIMLANFFGPAAAGFYTLGRSVLGMPSTLIGKSVGDVFYPRITEAAHNDEDLTNLILKATLALAAIGFVPFTSVVAFGPWLFSFVFGSEWVIAGEYARWLALWKFFSFLNRPSVAAIATLSLQRFFLNYEIISIVVRVAALIIGFYFFSSDTVAVILFCLAGVFLNLLLITSTLSKSRKFKQKMF